MEVVIMNTPISYLIRILIVLPILICLIFSQKGTLRNASINNYFKESYEEQLTRKRARFTPKMILLKDELDNNGNLTSIVINDDRVIMKFENKHTITVKAVPHHSAGAHLEVTK